MSEQPSTVMNDPTSAPDGYFGDGSFRGTHCFYCKQPWGSSAWCAVCSAWTVRRALAQQEAEGVRLSTKKGQAISAIERIRHMSGSLTDPTPRTLRDAVMGWDFSAADLESYLPPPSVHPYGRRLLFRSDHFELLVMNWAPGRKCAPHDHGQSWGWFVVLEGVATHALYRIDGHGVPVLRQTRTERQGRLVFAPSGRVHSMGNPRSGRLITLHAYAPPIVGMKVYDLRRCAACVVSEDCGAWWPESQRQLLRQIRLGPEQ